MHRPKISLIWKLVGINLLGVGLAVLMVWLVIDHFAADYFMGLMKEFKIDPKILHHMFLHAIHQYLLLSMLLGLGAATLLGFFITRKVMRSLTEMNLVTRRLAAGDYSERVRVTTRDEVGELGRAFNQMVGSLERIEQMRKELVANVAHELRTPLNNLRGQLEAIQDRLISPSPETINALHEEVLRLVRLVEALHRLSQIDAGTEVMRREQFDLRSLIGEIVEKERGRFEEKAIRLSIDASPVSVVGDVDQMVQVVRNLIQNVLQYTPRGGEASLRMKIEDRGVRLSFINSGEGIRREDLPHIFERFYRGEKSRSRESGGAGIGLAIVKQVVEAHGGSVGAESVPGKTEIWMRLPL
jgi:two-component system sensor histidine kinase BaeS